MNNSVLVLRSILEKPDITQRELAACAGISLGTVNSLLAALEDDGLIKKNKDGLKVTASGMKKLKPYKVDRAVILAAGFGSRFVPLTWETPKGLLEVCGERMVERQIKQLREVGITDIYIMVGYLKEKFEYLIDKYDIKLIFNPEYDHKNTISTLYHAREVFKKHNCYLLNSDNWLRKNMYHTYEPDSWYSASYEDGSTSEWVLTFNKKKLITDVTVGGRDAWVMYGPIYFSREFSDKFFPVLEDYYKTPGTEQDYWEKVYMDWVKGLNGLNAKSCPELYINQQPSDQVYEFENLEELRAFDEKYLHTSDNEAMKRIADVFKISEAEITGLKNLKAGMTNRSFGFTVKGKKYICRIPGEGTELLVDRAGEYETIKAVKNLGITENIVYYDPKTGYKISEFYPDARVADVDSEADMKRCMAMIRRLHESDVTVGHDFDIAERLSFYENLCLTHGGIPYEDYNEVRANSKILIEKLSKLNRPKTLSHIDSVKDNFLFINNDYDLKLIDWEYAGMADPLIDIAMCSIYSYLNKEKADWLTDLYFENEEVYEQARGIVYAYMALGGLLWALWAIYKSELGVGFGEYTLIMYRYAKDFYKLSVDII